jgi:hypothetical protein
MHNSVLNGPVGSLTPEALPQNSHFCGLITGPIRQTSWLPKAQHTHVLLHDGSLSAVGK